MEKKTITLLNEEQISAFKAAQIHAINETGNPDISAGDTVKFMAENLTSEAKA